MYKGFCINKSSISLALSKYLVNEDRKLEFRNIRYILDTKQSDVTSRIAKNLKGDANGIIDGEALQNACMPTANDKYDIFISHSHIEEKAAKDLAAYLKMRYGLRCFVDGFVWGSCDNNILRPIDEIWSWQTPKKESFSYEKRNYSTSLVHAMLSMALLEMIDKCECCIFIKPTTDLVVSGIGDCTSSPWIYEEIMMFNKVWKRKPERTTRCMESFSATGPKPIVKYKLDLTNMPLLSANHLQKYISDDGGISGYTKGYRWLDDLYDNVK